MSEHLILMYRLRPGVTPEAYEAWVRDHDAPYVRSRPTVIGFEIYRLGEAIGGAADHLPAYVEMVEVTSIRADQAALAEPRGRGLTAAWQELADGAVIVNAVQVMAYRRVEGERT